MSLPTRLVQRVAILGAPGSGKTQLAQQLTTARPQLQIADAPALQPDHAHQFELTLLMGLDLLSSQASDRVQQEADACLRRTLHAQQIPYSTVYGRDAQRLRNALRLIQPEPAREVRWRGVCESCSDPQCERRLFTGWRQSMVDDHPQS